MGKIKHFFCGLLENVFFGIKTSYSASKVYFSLKLVILLSTTMIPLVNIWLWKEVLNGIVEYEKSDNTVIFYLTMYLFLKLIAYLLAQINTYVNSRYSNELQFYIETVMMKKTSRMDLSFFDSAKIGDKVRQTRNNFGVITQMTWLVFDIISSFINVVVTFVFVCSYKWWLGIVTLILVLPFLVYNKKRTDTKLVMEKEQLRDKRILDYYQNTVYANNIQFEIKLNNIGDYFIKKYNKIWKKLHRINTRESIRHYTINTVIMFLNISSTFLVLTFSVFDVVWQKIGVGDLQYNLSMVSRLRAQAQA